MKIRLTTKRFREARRRLPYYTAALGPTNGFLLWLKLRLAFGNGIRTARIPAAKHPIRLRGNSADIVAFENIFFRHDVPLARIPGTPGFIIDGGAHVGLASIVLANRYPGARIVAVEAEASNAAMLRANVARYPNVEAIEAAIWWDAVPVAIANPAAGKMSFFVEPAQTGTNAVTIDQLIARSGQDTLDVLKLDVEGAEKEVFEHARSWIGQVGTLLVELHDRKKPGCREALEQALFGAAIAERFQTHEYEGVVFARATGAAAAIG